MDSYGAATDAHCIVKRLGAVATAAPIFTKERNRMAINPMSFEAQQLLIRLEKLTEGETVAWADLDDLIGRNVRAKYGWVRTAQAAILRAGIVVEAVPGVGLKRIDPAEHLTVGERGLRASRLKAGRTLRKMTSMDKAQFDSLKNADKIRHNAVASMLGAVNHFASERKVSALETKFDGKRNVFDPSDTLRALS